MGLDHSPLIATDYLAYYIDPANRRSYIGSGITINGLVSGNGGSLVNGVGFGSTGTNYFIFDGVDDGIPFYVPNSGTTMTLEGWIKIKSTSNGMIFGFNLYDVWVNTGRLGYNTAVSDIYGLTSTQVTNLNLLNQWNHYVFEMRSDVSYSNNKIYINGQNQSLSQVTGTESASNRNFNSGNGRIACWLYSNSFFLNMDIGSFKIYNRALSSSEVLQNYNASKGRYGL